MSLSESGGTNFSGYTLKYRIISSYAAMSLCKVQNSSSCEALQSSSRDGGVLVIQVKKTSMP